jgi:predicted ferric reductase
MMNGKFSKSLIQMLLLLALPLLLAAQIFIALSGYKGQAGIIGAARAALLVSGRAAALMAVTLVLFQFVLSSRLKILDRLFGMHRLLRLHSITGPTAAGLALCHPFLIYGSTVPGGKETLADLWPELLGGVILLILMTIAATTLGRSFLELPYEKWKRIHQLAFVAVVLFTIHALVLGDDLESPGPLILFLALIACYAALFIRAKLLKPAQLKSHPFKVTDVARLSHDTWNLKLEPTGPNFSYLPGQFAFLTLCREGEKRSEHPFTISSSPLDKECITFTIKESGDFTNTIGRTKPGELARVEAPFGRFSCVKLPDFDRLVMIAGGVGITPMLSGLRYMAKSGLDKPLTLIWANKTEDDIFLAHELDELIAKLPNLTIHHVLSHQSDYDGLTGYVNKDLLLKLIPHPTRNTHVMLCGPPPMMKSVRKELRRIGIRRSRIHTEKFSF